MGAHMLLPLIPRGGEPVYDDPGNEMLDIIDDDGGGG